MLPNLFPLLHASSAVTALIGSAPMRFYRHGSAPQGVVAPYVTHRMITGNPANDMSDTPRADSCLVQVSCWSDNTGSGSSGIEVLATAVRNAIQERWDIEDFRDLVKDAETGRYRIDLDVRVFVHRSVASSS